MPPSTTEAVALRLTVVASESSVIVVVAGADVTVNLSNGQTITILNGASSGTVNVTASDDVYANGGSASATITGASGGNFEQLDIDATAATTTITDDSDATTVSLSATASVVEGGTITYTASLTNAAEGPVTVTLSNGQSITIADGTTSATVNVTASDDVYANGGSASATITGATGGNFEQLDIDATAATTSITDDSDVTTVSLSATGSVVEGGTITYMSLIHI